VRRHSPFGTVSTVSVDWQSIKLQIDCLQVLDDCAYSSKEKPLKRFPSFYDAVHTHLKVGVNEK
jgi:hypothetical protein